MKRITKILTVIIITALLFAALPAANAQVYRDTSTGAVISVPDNWSYTKLPVTDNYSVYDSNLRNIQKTSFEGKMGSKLTKKNFFSKKSVLCCLWWSVYLYFPLT